MGSGIKVSRDGRSRNGRGDWLWSYIKKADRRENGSGVRPLLVTGRHNDMPCKEKEIS